MTISLGIRLAGMTSLASLVLSSLVSAEPPDFTGLLHSGYTHGTYTFSGDVVVMADAARPIAYVFSGEATATTLTIRWGSGMGDFHGTLVVTKDGGSFSTDVTKEQKYADPNQAVAVAMGISMGCVEPIYALWSGHVAGLCPMKTQEMPSAEGDRIFKGEPKDGMTVTVGISRLGDLHAYDVIHGPETAAQMKQNQVDPKLLKEMMKNNNTAGLSDEEIASSIAELQKVTADQKPSASTFYTTLRFVWPK